jgi:hypothetical protein
MIVIAITAGIYHGIAMLFGGIGKWGQLVFCLCIVQAPYLLLTSLIQAFVLASPSLSSLELLSWMLGLYTIMLDISAINAVEKIGTGKSTATFFTPVIIGILLVLVAYFSQ